MIRNRRKSSMTESYGVYDLINYFDVWGNEEDGWDVNDLSRDETDIYISDDLTDEEIVDYLIDEVGFLSPQARGNVEVWNDGDMIEFSVASTGEPLGRLERTRTVNESKRSNRSRNRKYVNESFDKYLDGVYSYVRKINNEVPPSDGYLDVYDCGDGSYKLVVMDDRGRVIKDVSDCYKPMPFVSFVRGLYQTLKQW